MPSNKVNGVKDPTKGLKPKKMVKVKSAKYGFHTGKNLSKTRQLESSA